MAVVNLEVVTDQQEADAHPEAADDAPAQRLSRGQKKKLRQRAAASETASVQAPASAANQGQACNRVKRHRSPSSSSSLSPSPSSSCSESECFSTVQGACAEEHASAHIDETLRPQGALPPEWPSAGAELISRHELKTSPPLVGQHLRLAALSFPQPKDPLQWRIFPLVRNALALAVDDELTLAELVRYVEDNLPPVCLLRISSTRLNSLVDLVVTRNVRFGRLRQHGKRISLAHAENPRLLVPHLADARLEVIWVAWCTDLKRPMEVAFRYVPVAGTALLPFWLCAQLGIERQSQCRASAECMKIGQKLVEFSGPCSSMSWGGAVREDCIWWSLLPPSGMTEDVAVELARQVIEQDGIASAAAGAAL